MSRLIPFVALFLVVTPITAAPVPKEKTPIEVEVLPLATTLAVGDPFEAFVRFTNTTDDKVFLLSEPNLVPGVGNVRLEVKGPGDREFRRPVVKYPPVLGDDTGERYKWGVKAGDSRCELLALPGTEDRRGEAVFDTAGEWRVRAVVVMRNKDEKVSAEVAVKVAGRSAEEVKQFRETVGKINRLWEATRAVGDEFDAAQKLVDDLGACYTADGYRRRFLAFRVHWAGTDQSKEHLDTVLKEADAYLKTASDPVRDEFCLSLAKVLFYRRCGGEPDWDALPAGRKYLDRVKCLPDSKKSFVTLYEDKERLLKAKPAEKK